ncbi:MAG: hypothetical protein HZA54_18015 [Planctomycetes bacterium]|nr:hypothetical protein [Planctomycetota bacterium]
MDTPDRTPNRLRAAAARLLLLLGQSARHLRAGFRSGRAAARLTLRRRACDREHADFGRVAWTTGPGLDCPPHTVTLADLDVKQKVAEAEIARAEALVVDLEGRRQETAARLEALLERNTETLARLAERINATEAAGADAEGERMRFETEAAPRRAAGVASAAPAAPRSANADAPARPGPDPLETARHLAAAAARIEKAAQRVRETAAELAPLREQETAARAEHDRLAAERDKTLGDLDAQARSYREQIELRRADLEDLEARRAPLFVQLGQKLYELRAHPDQLAAPLARLDALKAAIAALEGERAALTAEMAALPRSARALSAACLVAPVLALALVAWLRWGPGAPLASPERAFAAAQSAVAERDWGALFDLFAAPRRQAIGTEWTFLVERINSAPPEERAALARFFGLDPEHWKSTAPREYFIAVTAQAPAESGPTARASARYVPRLEGGTLLRVEPNAEHAERVNVIWRPAGAGADAGERLPLRYEVDGWRLDLP